MDKTKCFLVNLHTKDIAKTGFRNFSKCVKNRKLKCHIYISIQTLYSVLCWITFGSDYSLKSSLVWCYKLGTPLFGEFLPFFSAYPLKLCQVGWGASLHNYFQVSPEMFNGVKVRAPAGPLLRCLSCVFRVFVVLEGVSSPQSEVLSALDEVVIKHLSVLFSFLISFDPD